MPYLARFLTTVLLIGAILWFGAAANAIGRTGPAAEASGLDAVTATAGQPGQRISPGQAAVLGIVEGLTEYLPVSSTGHLVLASSFLGLAGSEAINSFEVVIQIGAVLAVLGLYRRRVGQMLNGLIGRQPAGLRLLGLLLVAFLPAAIIGLAAEKSIDRHLFKPWPVIGALVVGGVAMIVVEKWRKRTPAAHAVTIDTMTFRAAVLIGLAQCLAMWPGTSRSMVTIVAALLVGLEVGAAAEFSFLLALPTLSGAAVVKLFKHGGQLAQSAGTEGMLLGLGLSCLVAALAVKAFVSYLTRRGLEPFGYYRIALGLVLIALVATNHVRF